VSIDYVAESDGSIKKWKCPEGIFVTNFVGHEAIINTMSVNEEGVMFSGADNGSLTLWDYNSGLPFQHLKDIPQPGSLDAEAVSTKACQEADNRVCSVLLSTRREQDSLRVERTRRSRCIPNKHSCMHVSLHVDSLDRKLGLLDIGQVLLVWLQSRLDPISDELVDLFWRSADKRSGIQERVELAPDRLKVAVFLDTLDQVVLASLFLDDGTSLV